MDIVTTSLRVDTKTLGESYSCARRGAYKCVEVVQRSLIKDVLIRSIVITHTTKHTSQETSSGDRDTSHNS